MLTYPIVGNYGVPPDETDEQGIPRPAELELPPLGCCAVLQWLAFRYFEGARIYPVAVVVSEYSFAASHYSAVKSLSQWLQEPRPQRLRGNFGVAEAVWCCGNAGTMSPASRG